jgi:hypothetical protein
VAKTNISELYSRNPAAPSQVITAAADPRAASSIEQASTGTPASSTTSAVPRADPFITAVPRSTAGTVNVSSELAAASDHAVLAGGRQSSGPVVTPRSPSPSPAYIG